MDNRTPHELERLFYPRSIAVVGASPNMGSMRAGNNYIEGSIKQNYRGKIYPVHPKAENTLGYRSYARVRDIPDEVDLVIFAVPVSAVLPVMGDCVEKGVKFVHLFTAGFSETGREEYAETERELIRLAEKGGIRIVGPNCMGLYCPEGGIAFQPDFSGEVGSVGFFSQSGQLAALFIMLGTHHGLSFSKVISYGNASDLQAHDFLNYLGQDDKTEVIGSYMEGLKDGRNFFEQARNITRAKPLVVYKGGQTEGGSRATRSHTGSIAGSMDIWEAFCKQAGIISVSSLEEMACILSALKMKIPPIGLNVAILGGTGGGGVTMTDIAEQEGLKVPHLAEETIQSLDKIVRPEGSSVKNPLDVGLAMFMDNFLPTLMQLLHNDPNIDVLIFVHSIFMIKRFMGRPGVEMLFKMTLEAKAQLKKPVFAVLERDALSGDVDLHNEMAERLRQAGIPTFPSIQMAASILYKMNMYKEYRKRS